MPASNLHEISSLHYHLRFYQPLQAGIEPANTQERKHFISAIMGQVDAKNDHEIFFKSIFPPIKEKLTRWRIHGH